MSTSRIFKARVAALLESGNAPPWLQSVSISELEALEGGPSMLFQNLVDKQKRDAATLEAAALLTDTFTEKQLNALRNRKVDADVQVANEEEQATAKAEEHHKQEKSGPKNDSVPDAQVPHPASVSREQKERRAQQYPKLP
jgi:hypothetical protein